MTTPAERMRALGWAEELLGRIGEDPTVPFDLRQRVQQLVPAYPTRDQLLRMLHVWGARLPADAAQAVFDAGRVLVDYRTVGVGHTEWKQLWLGVLRHYPTHEDGWHSPDDLRCLPVGDFLSA